MRLTSTAFVEGAAIPARFTCDGEDVSPPLAWDGVPEGTQRFALVCDDPDAPVGVWDHWILFNIPGTATGLPEAMPADAIQPLGTVAQKAAHGLNSWGRTGYGGPCPPSGTHRYYFTLYALDTQLPLKAGVRKADLVRAMEGHILGQARLLGRYARR
ncbi:MAG: YbhB/YbcL family Raf kinase inhibitor-like protein [Desulfovibrionaceae bacterium]